MDKKSFLLLIGLLDTDEKAALLEALNANNMEAFRLAMSQERILLIRQLFARLLAA